MLTLVLAPFFISAGFMSAIALGTALMACCAFLGLNALVVPVYVLTFLAAMPLGFLLAVRVGKWLIEAVTGERHD